MRIKVLSAVFLHICLLLMVNTPFQLAACTLWGAAGDEALGGTIISKNRDWKPDHVQVLKMRRSENSYAYFGLYAEGNDEPGLKQGVNEKGLAVVTATAGSIPKATRKAQPGRGGTMSTLLASYSNCDDILADQEKLFSNRRPSFLMVSDGKKILMIEIGMEGRYAIKIVESGTVVHSNHYLEESLSEFNLKVSTSSTTRVKRIDELLQAAPKPFDIDSFVGFSKDQNDGTNNSLWRTGTNSCTLSSWIVEIPAQGPPKLRVEIANPGQSVETHNFVLDETFWNDASVSSFQPTPCEGVYPEHLQGICTNGRDALYWSWTDAMVKTDLHGRILKRVPADNHHGDLCFHDGKVFVAVNLGKFNRPAGEADSWIYVYDAETLEELARHRIPELVHGAGGIAYHNGKFIVVGGLPEGTEENYLYEYDEDFVFQKRHVLPSGYTRLGIQTAAYADGSWWFGCYGKPAILLRTDESFRLTGKWEFDAALGIVNVGKGQFLIGKNDGSRKTGYIGRAIGARVDVDKGLIAEDVIPAREVQIDANFPGGNIIQEKIEDDIVTLRHDPRDTEGWWFYWYFRVSGAAGRTLTFNFTDGAPIGVRGPAVSLDGGLNWNWLGKPTSTKAFTYTFPTNANFVRFSFGMPYTEANWKTFLARIASNEFLKQETLCQSRKGRAVERLHIGKLDGEPNFRMLVTACAHACEMMASYAAEGIIEAVLADDSNGEWFRKNVELLVIPFVDKDGVEDGDQGKNRRPRDHNRDYDANSVYPETRAIQDFVPAWSKGKLRLAFDLHCPHIRGDSNEKIYLVGNQNPEIWKEQQRFGELLEQVQKGTLVYRVTNNLPFGTKWNTSNNYKAGTSGSRWSASLPGVQLATTIELPYANASGGEVNAGTSREFGRDLAAAIRNYLELSSKRE